MGHTGINACGEDSGSARERILGEAGIPGLGRGECQFWIIGEPFDPKRLAMRGYALTTAHARTTDGTTFYVYADNSNIEALGDERSSETYYITEYELDDGTRSA